MTDPCLDRTKDGRPLVDCDDLCAAFKEPDPDSLEELRAALEHWKSHGVLFGCSHAC